MLIVAEIGPIVDTSHDMEFAKNFLVTSTATSLGRLAMARSSSSMILMNKMRHRRRRLSASNPRQLLLLPAWPQVLPLALMMLLQGRRSIIVTIRGPIRRLMAATAADVAPMSLRMLRQEQGDAAGVLQGHP
jgi:hypothetical protein